MVVWKLKGQALVELLFIMAVTVILFKVLASYSDFSSEKFNTSSDKFEQEMLK